MAAIASLVPPTAGGSFAAAISTLSASDTITFSSGKKQLLVLRNTTGGSLTVNIDGDGIDSVNVAGIGAVSVADGYDIVVAAGASAAVLLGSIKHYCQGVVTLSGASGLTAQLFDL